MHRACTDSRVVGGESFDITGEWSMTSNVDWHDDGFFKKWFTAQQQLYESPGMSGWVFWTWKTELNDPRWTYSYATSLKYVPTDAAGLEHNVYQDSVQIMSIHHLEEIWSVTRDSLGLHIRWNDARLIIQLNRASDTSSHPLENSFIERYNAASYDEDYEAAEALFDEILDAIVKAGRQRFDELAPPPPPPTGGTGRLVCENTPTTEGSFPDPFGPFQLLLSENCGLPRYSTKDIRVLENLANNGYIARVEVDGQVMCWKTGDIKGLDAAQGELDGLGKISASGCASTLRVPKLLGLVQNGNTERVAGILLEYIPAADSWELSTLGRIDSPSSIAEIRRKKWVSQVQETVHQLHEMGVIWGDGKASNVLIHRDSDDAWIIDFGGGWTDGWLDRELSGTIEGDATVVRKIFELLDV
ncbi:hypothetical protein NLG97_g5844 [Lecanicillium saksenae]|uniref:Uncharacterized protein n=1 Tax=Lecanicillium saksenae TaxID=468837 RepID=A0ACC1QT01_9HYPO|nr:hypothetical protein NLG97_g5844 [Lecanicillium saksenae]